MSDEVKPPSPLFKTQPPGMNVNGEKQLTKQELIQAIRDKERIIHLKQTLPHIYGWKWYPWARQFFESKNKINLLCAANQISKSSTQIRKCIHWATDKSIWADLWNLEPKQFWYLYPSKDVVNAEFETKWSQFLPADKDDPVYGYRVEKNRGYITALHFHSGVHVYFKTYAQDTTNLQSGTCDAIFCDEELPVAHYEELMFRLSASDGYFHMVFTATLGQDFWRRALDAGANEKEELVSALKLTISLYDAMVYEDGTPSHWTMEKIKQVEARCSTENEILKRVYGKFIVIGGKKYEQFDIKRHMKPTHKLPQGWLYYVGVDPGSGGKEGHPSAICYVAVSPDFRKGRVVGGWRGDGLPTTAGDVVQKNMDLKKAKGIQPNNQYYDWASKDFFNIATSMNEPFEMADKNHEKGEDVLNTLFKHDMLLIYEDEETIKLGGELATLKKLTPKNKAKDDFADALRYAVTKIPWDFSFISGTEVVKARDEQPEEPMNDTQRQIMERRKGIDNEYDEAETRRINEEFAEWNDLYGE